MIVIEFETERGNTLIVDVVNQRLKAVSIHTKIPDEWVPYLRLENGKVGEILTVVYPDGSEYQTAKIVRMRYEKLQAPKPEPKAPEQGDQ